MSSCRRRIAVAGLAFILGAACARPRLNTGEGCQLNTDCEDPLVCGLERCRRQCVDSRDCAAGLLCLAIGDLGGVCQLPSEAACSLTSDCPEGLACVFGTCTTECLEDRDCPPGATCSLDDATGTTACVETIRELCIYDSDCLPPRVCTAEQICWWECIEDVDCENPRVCVANRCELPPRNRCP